MKLSSISTDKPNVNGLGTDSNTFVVLKNAVNDQYIYEPCTTFLIDRLVVNILYSVGPSTNMPEITYFSNPIHFFSFIYRLQV